MINETSALDLDLWVGQRSTQYKFQVVDGTTGELRGELHPARGSAPSLSHDTTATVTRTLQGLTLEPSEVDLFRPLVDLVELTMIIDGVGEYPLGRYVAADDVRTAIMDGVSGDLAYLRPMSLQDEMLIVDQKLYDSFSARGLLISEVIRVLLAGLPIKDPPIGPCSMTSSAGWAAGTSRASVLRDLCVAGGYFSPWFDNSSYLRCIQAFDPALQAPTIDFDTVPRVLRDSITITDESISAPNRFVVVSNDTGAADGPFIGIYDVPSTAPHSYQNRGYYIPDVRDAQVDSTAQAQIYARTVGIQQTIVERLECETPPDPRHDGYDVIRFLGENWLEIGWSITLTGTGTMRHTLSRTYLAGTEGY